MANDWDMNDSLRPSPTFCLKLRFKLFFYLDFKNLGCHFNCLFIPVGNVETLLQVNVMGVNKIFLTSPSGILDLYRV